MVTSQRIQSIILTKKIVYSLEALYFLEVVRHNEMTNVQEIADRLAIPKRFLEQLFLRLRREGFLQSVRGPQGGYRLVRSLREIALRDLLTALNDRSGAEPEGEGRYGEGAFVQAVADQLDEAAATIRLGNLITADMRRRALAAEGPGYVYQI